VTYETLLLPFRGRMTGIPFQALVPVASTVSAPEAAEATFRVRGAEPDHLSRLVGDSILCRTVSADNRPKGPTSPGGKPHGRPGDLLGRPGFVGPGEVEYEVVEGDATQVLTAATTYADLVAGAHRPGTGIPACGWGR
jgi:hypothetical protein